MPKWRIAIVVREQKRQSQGKTIVQLFLEILSEVEKDCKGTTHSRQVRAEARG